MERAVCSGPSRQHHRFLKDRQVSSECAVCVDDERPAVEHQFVLAPDLIHVHEREPCLARPIAGERQALIEFADLVWRTVRDEQQLGALARKVCGHGREPDVFADRKPEPQIAEGHWLRQRARREHALLVEHAVIGELVLESKHMLPVRDERHRVVEASSFPPGKGHEQRWS